MNVLVTGHKGFIGSHTVALLKQMGYSVFGMDTAKHAHNIRGLKIPEVIPGDITAIADHFLEGREIHAIIHLAAQPSLLSSIDDPVNDCAVNAIGTIKLLLAARRAGVKKFVFSSTSAVYNPGAQIPLTEEYTRLAPSRPYGISKMAAESYIRAIFPRAIIFRYGNVYGPKQVPVGENQIVPRFLSFIYNGQPFEIYGDGKQVRDFVYVEDVARANAMAVESEVSGTFNVSSGVGASVNKITDILKDKTGYAGMITHIAPKPDEQREIVLDVSRAAAYLKWRSQTSLVDGLQKTVDWWVKNQCP